MPFDASGNFSRLYDFEQDRNNGIKILASRVDGEFDNFASGMNLVFFRSGIVAMTGDLNMGLNRINGLSDGAAANPAIKWNSDPLTGLYMAGYGKLGISTGGSERATFDSTGMAVSGKVGSNFLQVSAAAGQNAWTQYGTNVANYFTGLKDAVDAYFVREGQFSDDLMSFTRAQNRSYKPFLSDGKISRDTFLYMDVPVAGLADLSFDTGDVLRYTRGTNQYDMIVNSSSVLAANASGVTVPGFLNVGGQIRRDTNMYLDLPSGTPTLSMDAGDLLQYDRTNNFFNFFIASGLAARITATGSSFTGSLGTTGALSGASLAVTNGISAASVASTGAITQGGNQVYHAGNFNPSSYAALNSAPSFTGQVSTPTLSTNSVLISGGGSNNAYVGYGTNIANYSAGIPQGIDAWRINENQFNANLFQISRGGASINVPTVVAGKISRDTYLYMDVPVAGIADVSFDTGDVLRYTRSSDQYDFIVNSASRLSVNASGASIAGGLTTAGRVNVVDSNHYMDIISGFTTHSFDAGDLIQYDRANNKFLFIIGSQRVASLDASGNFVVKGNISSTNGGAVP